MNRALVLSVLLSGCAGPLIKSVQRPPIPAALSERGDTVYFGSSFALKGASSEPTFIYERRVEGTDYSTHITREPTGDIAVIEGAAHSAAYALSEYTLYVNQLGQTGSVSVSEDRATFTLIDAEGEKHTRVEKLEAPIVVGPTLVGFLFTHLDALRAKQTIPVRFAVLDRLETIGFELSAVDSAEATQTRIEMRPTGFLYRIAVAPLFFTFETSTGKLIRMEGRIPPKTKQEGRWADFDARVEYRFVADAYR